MPATHRPVPTESVWDYPRPPAVVPCERTARVELAGRVVAESDRALRVLETASPPTIYIPREEFVTDALEPARGRTFCEWKGSAAYYDIVVEGRRAVRAAWYYPRPRDAFASLADHLSVYPGRVDACYLGDERVQPQPGSFYGGWVTSNIEGPFKGSRGTLGW